jgi:predicted membrane protein
MPGRLLRALSALLLAWFVFMVGAMVYAKVMGRTAGYTEPDADDVDLVANFSELKYRSTATSFRGGSVTTWFGGGIVDLRDAVLDPAGATLRLNAMFGGGSLVIPADWRVEMKLVNIAGGIGDSRPGGNPPLGAPTLRLEGSTLFGGWGISSEEPGEELVTV